MGSGAFEGAEGRESGTGAVHMASPGPTPARAQRPSRRSVPEPLRKWGGGALWGHICVAKWGQVA